MQQYLIDYIRKELKKGFSHQDIKKTLVKAGHAVEVIEEHLAHVKEEEQRLKGEIKKDEKELKQIEREIKIDDRLLAYIKHELAMGHHEEHIKEKLMSVGHELHVIEHHLEHVYEWMTRRKRIQHMLMMVMIALIVVGGVAYVHREVTSEDYAIRRAYRQLEEGNHETALSMFEAIVAADPSRELALRGLGDAYAGTGDLARAIEVLESIPEDSPDYGGVICSLARFYYSADDSKQSVTHYRQCLQGITNPTGKLVAFSRLARGYRALGNETESKHWTQLALMFMNLTQKAPSWLDMPDDRDYGFALNRLGHHAEAIAFLERAIQRDSRDVEALSALGVALRTQEDADAEKYLKRSIELETDYIYGRLKLGELYRELDRYDEAITQYQSVLELNDRSFKAHTGMGYALYMKGGHGAAAGHFEKSIQIYPRDGAAHYGLGLSLAAEGKTEESSMSINQALEINPNEDYYLSFVRS
jgi:tetratricopeptide (TPR) repeat protein